MPRDLPHADAPDADGSDANAADGPSDELEPGGSGDPRLDAIFHAPADGPAVVTFVPADVEEADLPTTWITAEAGTVVDLADRR